MTAPNSDCTYYLGRTWTWLIGIIVAINIVEAQLKDIVQNLYNLIVQSFDHHGNKTQEAMKREMYVKESVWLYIDQAHKHAASRSFTTW